jgi:AcrR family transcriptional regulator
MRSAPRLDVPTIDATRARLLREACLVFAERGFKAATVRDVCRRAGVNSAAVNYHFGTKENLYLEALREALASTAPPVVSETGEPRARLRRVIRELVVTMLGGSAEWTTRLIVRELSQPTFALDVVVREFMLPRFRALEAALAPLLPGADERTRALHVMSVIGQVIYHRVGAPVALRILGEPGYSPDLVARIADHIVAFTERALAGGTP